MPTIPFVFLTIHLEFSDSLESLNIQGFQQLHGFDLESFKYLEALESIEFQRFQRFLRFHFGIR